MPRLKAAIEIDAPREHVFALAGDLTKRPDWTTFVKEVVITAGDGKSAGTKDKTTAKIGPQSKKWEGTVIQYEAAELLARSFQGYFTGEEQMTFAPSGNGTRVEWSVNYTPPFGLLGKFGAWFMMARFYQNELEGSLEKLKAELEV